MKNFILFLFLVIGSSLTHAKDAPIDRVEPAFWWVGMKYSDIQLIVYGDDISSFDVEINYSGFNLKKVHQVENPNYLFLDITTLFFALFGLSIVLLKDFKEEFFADKQLFFSNPLQLFSQLSPN